MLGVTYSFKLAVDKGIRGLELRTGSVPFPVGTGVAIFAKPGIEDNDLRRLATDGSATWGGG